MLIYYVYKFLQYFVLASNIPIYKGKTLLCILHQSQVFKSQLFGRQIIFIPNHIH